MHWNTYRPSERTRRDKPLPNGFVSINDTTGEMRIGDGRTLLDDLEAVGGGGESSGGDTGGFRIVRGSLYGADNDALVAGQVIGRLAHGEHVAQTLLYYVTPFDAENASLALGVDFAPDGKTAFTNGSAFVGGDNAVNPDPNEYTGLVNMPIAGGQWDAGADGTPAQVSVGPPGGIDIVATLDDGSGGDPGCTTGEVSFSLLIVGWLKPF